MRQLRISGIVGTANHVRRVLSGPLGKPEREKLAAHVQRTVQQIEAVLRDHGGNPANLPAPSRRAYQFLKGLDFRKLPAPDANSVGGSPGQDGRAANTTLRFPGLRSFLDGVLDDISRRVSAGTSDAAATGRIVRNTAERLEHMLHRERATADRLREESRDLLGWFRYFSREEKLASYFEAVKRAQDALLPLLSARARWRPPLLVHFRPSSMLYRLRITPLGTRIVFDTPMITFSREDLVRIGRRIAGHGRHQPEMMAAMLSAAYQQVLADLQAEAGLVERTRGMAYDLADSFDRVNREYFAGQMPRPFLGWSRTITGRKYGHYDFIHNRICISVALDRPDVPVHVLDHVMHHELLHKKHGFEFQGNRQHAHTPAFRAEEKQFKQYQEACAFLNQLTASR
jgi:hypothetical protein